MLVYTRKIYMTQIHWRQDRSDDGVTLHHNPSPNDDDGDEDTTAVILRSAHSLLGGWDRSISRVLISYFIHYYTCTNIYRCFH